MLHFKIKGEINDLVQWSPNILAPGTAFMEDNFSTEGGAGSGSNASDGERWGVADEALLSHPPLTSCVHGPGVGDP